MWLTLQTLKNAQKKMQKIDEYQKSEVEKFSDALSKVSIGDLSINYNPADADEDTKAVKNSFDQLASSMSIMVKAMLEISELAKEISIGNLTVTAVKRSEQDVLMDALGHNDRKPD